MLKKLINSKMIKLAIGNIIIPPLFFGIRFFKDQAFLIRLKNKNIKPLYISYPIYYFFRGFDFFGQLIRAQFMSYALGKYNHYIAVHYSKYGRGYFSYENLTDDEKREIYNTASGRIQAFIDQYPNIIKYRDGNSFFDAGCGSGQNIRPLRERFPKSFIHGIDLSKEAVEVIKAAVNDDKLKVEAADLKDIRTFEALEDEAYDHVVMSHVFPLIIGSDLATTKALREAIIKEFVRIAKKSVLIIDGPAIVASHEYFEIEQLNRGIFKESIEAYFPVDEGNVLALRAAHHFGVLFLKSDQS